jgi:enolase-phosphatase E1
MAHGAATDGRDVPAVLALEGDVVLLDIEGTISPVTFVRDVLFSYARARLAGFVAEHANDTEVAPILKHASELAGGGDALAALAGWQDRDEKVPPLKKLQGLIWDKGYRDGAFKAPIFPDALAAFARWRDAGLKLYIYSSGSLKAQLLFFAHSVAGDLRPMFSGHYDTDIGPKVEATSYARIVEQIGAAPGRVIFFSDSAKELEAARAAGLQVVHVVKDDTLSAAGLPEISDFEQVEIARAVRPRGEP